MKKFILLLATTSLLSVTAFADSTYKSSETIRNPDASSSTVREEQQRMEDGARMKTKEATSTVKEPGSMHKKKVETKKTEYKDGMAE